MGHDLLTFSHLLDHLNKQVLTTPQRHRLSVKGLSSRIYLTQKVHILTEEQISLHSVFYLSVNVTVKVPKSVVALLFLMIFILGIFAMEWWFPWLIGENQHVIN